ncbi:Hypothetical protein HVR_LOCUS1088 [uncultured virus]|nr:Hypothetical protein HVR_LOCUS1088 [uncultured virus]
MFKAHEIKPNLTSNDLVRIITIVNESIPGCYFQSAFRSGLSQNVLKEISYKLENHYNLLPNSNDFLQGLINNYYRNTDDACDRRSRLGSNCVGSHACDEESSEDEQLRQRVSEWD